MAEVGPMYFAFSQAHGGKAKVIDEQPAISHLVGHPSCDAQG